MRSTSYEATIALLVNGSYQVTGGPSPSGSLNQSALLALLRTYALADSAGEPISADDVISNLNTSNAPVSISLVQRVA
jgi:hypothetical protein